MAKEKRQYTREHYLGTLKYQKEKTFQTSIRYTFTNPVYIALEKYSKDHDITIRAILLKAAEQYMQIEGYLRVGEE